MTSTDKFSYFYRISFDIKIPVTLSSVNFKQKRFLSSTRTVTNKDHIELVCKQFKSKENDLSNSLISRSACLFYSYRNETIKTKQRTEADEQKTNTAPLVLRVRLAVVCCVLYRAISRGTQNTRTSSTDITLRNIL